MSVIKNERVKIFLNSLCINDVVIVKENSKTAKVLSIDYSKKEITVKWDIHCNPVSYSAFDVCDLWEVKKHHHEHKWNKYVGILDSYYYCSICDAKKPL
jgi:hypothetical protein